MPLGVYVGVAVRPSRQISNSEDGLGAFVNTISRALVISIVVLIPLKVIAQPQVVYARAKMPATGTPSGIENPPCNAASEVKNLGKSLVDKGVEGVGKATAGLGLTSDPFNTRRLNESVCMDLCVVIPQGRSFTAKASVAGEHSWQGDLPVGLPGLIKPGNWWAIEGPYVDSTHKGDVICYTVKNWSHNLERIVGVEVKY